MEIIREKTCGVTGHRLGKLKGSEKVTRQLLRTEIGKMVAAGISTFLVGGAEGVELWAADIVCKMKEKNGNLKLVVAVPFPGVEKKFSERAREKYAEILSKADRVETISDKYAADCFQKRDCWIVDHASGMIAVYNGMPGGTRLTIDYMRKAGMEPVIIEDKEVKRCTICGKELDCYDLQEKLEYDNIMGYGSRYDCCHVRIRLCCGCFDKLIGAMRRKGAEDPVICTDVRFAGEMSNDQANRMAKLTKYMSQAGADAIVERIARMNAEEIEAEIEKLEHAFGEEGGTKCQRT